MLRACGPGKVLAENAPPSAPTLTGQESQAAPTRGRAAAIRVHLQKSKRRSTAGFAAMPGTYCKPDNGTFRHRPFHTGKPLSFAPPALPRATPPTAVRKE